MSLKWMKLALQLAEIVPWPDCPIACVIVYGDTELARSVNETELRNDPTAHAELLCIQKACSIAKKRHLDGCILYCTLEPCPMCQEAINLARIEKVVFGAFRKKEANPCFKMIGGVLEKECSLVLSEFFGSLRRKS